MPAAKRPTAKEMREEEIRVGMEQTRKNLAEAPPASLGGSTSDDHGSEGGVPLEVAAEDAREAAREADRALMEERARERERKQWEEDAAEEGRDSSVEEVEDALPPCPPPSHYTMEEKEAWVQTVAFLRLCRKEGNKLHVKIPSDLACKWSKEQKAVWPKAKHELKKLQNMLNAVRGRAAIRKATRAVKREREGYTEDPEAVAAAGGKPRSQPAQPPFTANEKTRLVYCVACEEFRPCVAVMLRGFPRGNPLTTNSTCPTPSKSLPSYSTTRTSCSTITSRITSTVMRIFVVSTLRISGNARNRSLKVSILVPFCVV